MRPSTILITGVSSGIGRAAAARFCQANYTVFGTVRKPTDAEGLQTELGASFRPVLLDVTDHDAIAKGVLVVQEQLKGQSLGGLINNAGIAIGGPLQTQSMEVIRQHFEVNVFGLLALTRAFLPLLGATSDFSGTPGKIINISSVGGKIAAPFVGAYAGTKHAVEALSTSLRRELQLYGVDVIIVGPGSVKTPIWDKGVDITPFEGSDYEAPLRRFAKGFVTDGKNGMAPEVIADLLFRIQEQETPKVRYAPVHNRFKRWVLPRLLPARVLDRLIGRRTGLLK